MSGIEQPSLTALRPLPPQLRSLALRGESIHLSVCRKKPGHKVGNCKYPHCNNELEAWKLELAQIRAGAAKSSTKAPKPTPKASSKPASAPLMQNVPRVVAVNLLGNQELDDAFTAMRRAMVARANEHIALGSVIRSLHALSDEFKAITWKRWQSIAAFKSLNDLYSVVDVLLIAGMRRSGAVTMFDLEQLVVASSGVPNAKTFDDLGLGPLLLWPSVRTAFQLNKLTEPPLTEVPRLEGREVLALICVRLSRTQRGNRLEEAEFLEMLAEEYKVDDYRRLGVYFTSFAFCIANIGKSRVNIAVETKFVRTKFRESVMKDMLDAYSAETNAMPWQDRSWWERPFILLPLGEPVSQEMSVKIRDAINTDFRGARWYLSFEVAGYVYGMIRRYYAPDGAEIDTDSLLERRRFALMDGLGYSKKKKADRHLSDGVYSRLILEKLRVFCYDTSVPNVERHESVGKFCAALKATSSGDLANDVDFDDASLRTNTSASTALQKVAATDIVQSVVRECEDVGVTSVWPVTDVRRLGTVERNVCTQYGVDSFHHLGQSKTFLEFLQAHREQLRTFDAEDCARSSATTNVDNLPDVKTLVDEFIDELNSDSDVSCSLLDVLSRCERRWRQQGASGAEFLSELSEADFQLIEAKLDQLNVKIARKTIQSQWSLIVSSSWYIVGVESAALGTGATFAATLDETVCRRAIDIIDTSPPLYDMSAALAYQNLIDSSDSCAAFLLALSAHFPHSAPKRGVWADASACLALPPRPDSPCVALYEACATIDANLLAICALQSHEKRAFIDYALVRAAADRCLRRHVKQSVVAYLVDTLSILPLSARLACFVPILREFYAALPDLVVMALDYACSGVSAFSSVRRAALHSVASVLGWTEWMNDSSLFDFKSTLNWTMEVNDRDGWSTKISGGISGVGSALELPPTELSKGDDVDGDPTDGIAIDSNSTVAKSTNAKIESNVIAEGRLGAEASPSLPLHVPCSAVTLMTLLACKSIIEDIRHYHGADLVDVDNEHNDVVRALQERQARAVGRLSTDLYSMQTHYVLELLQNCDDNRYDVDVLPSVQIALDQRFLVLRCNEVGFEEANVRAICDIDRSTKSGTGTVGRYIGQKGIGFKAVFAVSDAPEVHSNGYHFAFDSKTFLVPRWLGDCVHGGNLACLGGVGEQWRTAVRLPLKESLASSVVHRQLRDIDPILLLFLQRVRQIEIGSDGGAARRLMRRVDAHDSDCDLESRVVEIHDNDSFCRFFVVRHRVVVPTSIERGNQRVDETEVAVALVIDSEARALRAQPTFAFLPLRSYGLRFILQADFLVPASRETITVDSEWNRFLRSQVPALFEKAFAWLHTRDETDQTATSLESVQFFALFPTRDYVTDAFFDPLCDEVADRMRSVRCVRSVSDTWCLPSRVISGARLRRNDLLLLDSVQRDCFLSAANENCELLDLEWARRCALDVRVQTALGVQFLTSAHLVSALHYLCGEWMQGDRDELSNEEFYARYCQCVELAVRVAKGAADSRRRTEIYARCRALNIFPVQSSDGARICVSLDGGLPAYLCIDEESGANVLATAVPTSLFAFFHILDASVLHGACSDVSRRALLSFFNECGVQQFDAVRFTRECVVSRLSADAADSLNDAQLIDLMRLLRRHSIELSVETSNNLLVLGADGQRRRVCESVVGEQYVGEFSALASLLPTRSARSISDAYWRAFSESQEEWVGFFVRRLRVPMLIDVQVRGRPGDAEEAAGARAFDYESVLQSPWRTLHDRLGNGAVLVRQDYESESIDSVLKCMENEEDLSGNDVENAGVNVNVEGKFDVACYFLRALHVIMPYFASDWSRSKLFVVGAATVVQETPSSALMRIQRAACVPAMVGADRFLLRPELVFLNLMEPRWKKCTAILPVVCADLNCVTMSTCLQSIGVNVGVRASALVAILCDLWPILCDHRSVTFNRDAVRDVYRFILSDEQGVEVARRRRMRVYLPALTGSNKTSSSSSMHSIDTVVWKDPARDITQHLDMLHLLEPFYTDDVNHGRQMPANRRRAAYGAAAMYARVKPIDQRTEPLEPMELLFRRIGVQSVPLWSVHLKAMDTLIGSIDDAEASALGIPNRREAVMATLRVISKAYTMNRINIDGQMNWNSALRAHAIVPCDGQLYRRADRCLIADKDAVASLIRLQLEEVEFDEKYPIFVDAKLSNQPDSSRFLREVAGVPVLSEVLETQLVPEGLFISSAHVFALNRLLLAAQHYLLQEDVIDDVDNSAWVRTQLASTRVVVAQRVDTVHTLSMDGCESLTVTESACACPKGDEMYVTLSSLSRDEPLPSFDSAVLRVLAEYCCAFYGPNCTAKTSETLMKVLEIDGRKSAETLMKRLEAMGVGSAEMWQFAASTVEDTPLEQLPFVEEEERETNDEESDEKEESKKEKGDTEVSDEEERKESVEPKAAWEVVVRDTLDTDVALDEGRAGLWEQRKLTERKVSKMSKLPEKEEEKQVRAVSSVLAFSVESKASSTSSVSNVSQKTEERVVLGDDGEVLFDPSVLHYVVGALRHRMDRSGGVDGASASGAARPVTHVTSTSTRPVHSLPPTRHVSWSIDKSDINAISTSERTEERDLCGRLGEFYAARYCRHVYGSARVLWLNERGECGLPFDILVFEKGFSVDSDTFSVDSFDDRCIDAFVEVKSTRSPSLRTTFYTSISEILTSERLKNRFHLLRVLIGSTEMLVDHYENFSLCLHTHRLELMSVKGREEVVQSETDGEEESESKRLSEKKSKKESEKEREEET